MAWFNFYCIIGIFFLLFFLGNVSIKFIKLENKLEKAIDHLEKELVAVFGTPMPGPEEDTEEA